jgi:hypothetical protein
VPVLELDNGERLTEGPAIVQYIADQVPDKKLAPANGTFARARLQEWLNFTTSEIHKTYSPLFNPAVPEEYKTMAKAKLVDRYRWVDAQLEARASCSAIRSASPTPTSSPSPTGPSTSASTSRASRTSAPSWAGSPRVPRSRRR